LLTRLSATLRADWQASFERSYADKGGLIVCLFTDDFGEESGGRKELLRYMYNLVKSHPASVEYVLRKLPSRWGKRSNGYIEFVLQPPWVSLSPYESYLRTHVEETVKIKVCQLLPPSLAISNTFCRIVKESMTDTVLQVADLPFNRRLRAEKLSSIT